MPFYDLFGFYYTRSIKRIFMHIVLSMYIWTNNAFSRFVTAQIIFKNSFRPYNVAKSICDITKIPNHYGSRFYCIDCFIGVFHHIGYLFNLSFSVSSFTDKDSFVFWYAKYLSIISSSPCSFALERTFWKGRKPVMICRSQITFPADYFNPKFLKPRKTRVSALYECCFFWVAEIYPSFWLCENTNTCV